MRTLRIVSVVVAVYALVYLMTADHERLSGRVFDDTFYFLKIAENLSTGHGSSFDGIHETNGFQPLWVLMLVPMFAFLHRSSEEMTRFALALQLVVLTAAFWLLIRTLRRLVEPEAMIVGGLGVVFLALHPAWNGMESPLVLLFLAWLLSYGLAASVFGQAGAREALVFGLILGLLFMSRLDTVFFGPPIMVVALLSGDQPFRLRLRRAFLIALGATLMVAPYLLWNLSETSSLMPISGKLKSTFPHISFEISRLGRFGSRYLLCLAASAAFLLHEGLYWRRARRIPQTERYLETALVVGAVAMWLHAIHSVLFMRWAVFRWHHIWYGMIAALIVMWALMKARQRWAFLRRPVLAHAITLAVFACGAAEVLRQDFLVGRSHWHHAAYTAAKWARENTVPGSVFGMYDAGEFGYFSDRPVINLDGVVNNRAYQEYLRQGRLEDYLRANHVTYLVSHELGKREDLNAYGHTFLRVRSQLYPSIVDSAEVLQSDEVYRSEPYSHEETHLVSFVIWRVSRSHSPD